MILEHKLKPDTLKLIEKKNLEKILEDIGTGEEFLNRTLNRINVQGWGENCGE